MISGRESPATAERASQVGMTWVFQGHIEKIPLFDQVVAEAQVDPREIAYVGDDLTDVVIMRRARALLRHSQCPPRGEAMRFRRHRVPPVVQARCAKSVS